ncbi:MAG: 2-C-methyl-D-erythritol 4-phosphate cytidylyltransferase [Burkholderiales bacterium PBB3]|nr:MAG: 2-C-methyl-D-erythritol 4-phosphate cytidylyltransferase [Burkholderiales bacterium PBB3]
MTHQPTNPPVNPSAKVLAPVADGDPARAALPGNEPRVWALIPCAGSGSRAGLDSPKQYQVVAGQPMVQHTLAAFEAVAGLAGGLVVVSEGDTFFDNAPRRFAVVACGGTTRAQSVLSGLGALLGQGAAPGDWVMVHDAARCLITPQQIQSLIAACLPDAVGGLLALKLPDTLKREAGGRVAQTVDRSDKWLAQTPQMFRIGELQAALRAAGDTVTDEASALEFVGRQPLLVEGSAQNFKVTYPQDFALAQAVLQSRGMP